MRARHSHLPRSLQTATRQARAEYVGEVGVNHLPARAELAASSARRRVEERRDIYIYGLGSPEGRLYIYIYIYIYIYGHSRGDFESRLSCGRRRGGRGCLASARRGRSPRRAGRRPAPRARRRSRSESSRRHMYTDDMLDDILGDIWMILSPKQRTCLFYRTV
jgi:hypothetical protein